MSNGVQIVRAICLDRGIPISTLEKECGFSNGYLNPKKLVKIPYDRALIIARYLGIPASLILEGEENAPALTEKDERDIARDLERIMSQLGSSGDLMFDGDPMSDEARESMLAAIELGLRAAKLKNKARFTPKKHRKG